MSKESWKRGNRIARLTHMSRSNLLVGVYWLQSHRDLASVVVLMGMNSLIIMYCDISVKNAQFHWLTHLLSTNFDSYILEGKELEFYMKKLQKKKGKGAGAAAQSCRLQFLNYQNKLDFGFSSLFNSLTSFKGNDKLLVSELDSSLFCICLTENFENHLLYEKKEF